jgi:ABC-2 type transport system ATP-binding protein
MTTAEAIYVRDLSRSFGAKLALADVDLTVGPGEVHALLGPNGAGKTTLIRILSGSVRPNSGEVRVMDVPWSELSRPSSRNLFGLVTSGDRSSYHRLSGLENLIFFGRLYGLSKPEAKRRGNEVLARVGLGEAASVRTGNYSHGMTKRLSMARALIMEPPVLLVDEATHDLDPAGARMVRDLLREAAARGAAVLWATQRVDEIRDTADSLTVLDQGRLRFSGTISEMTERTAGDRYYIELAGPPRTSLPATLGGLLEPVSRPGAYFLALPTDMRLGDAISIFDAAGLRVTICRQERSEIEEAFLALTSRPA